MAPRFTPFFLLCLFVFFPNEFKLSNYRVVEIQNHEFQLLKHCLNTILVVESVNEQAL